MERTPKALTPKQVDIIYSELLVVARDNELSTEEKLDEVMRIAKNVEELCTGEKASYYKDERDITRKARL